MLLWTKAFLVANMSIDMGRFTKEDIHNHPDATFVAEFGEQPIVYDGKRYEKLASVLMLEKLARRGRTQPEDDDPHERVVRHVEGLQAANEEIQIDEVFLAAYAISKELVEAK